MAFWKPGRADDGTVTGATPIPFTGETPPT